MIPMTCPVRSSRWRGRDACGALLLTGFAKTMKITRQKRLTKYFFNKVSDEWYERTYDPANQYLKFPSNRVRMGVALGEIEKLGLKGKMLDVGCGTGHLVFELLKRGHEAVGIDIAEKMIEQAKVHLKKSKIKANPEEVFIASDLAAFTPPAKNMYTAITALGLLEYLDTDGELFELLAKNTARGGYAFVECRNKFFNLFSSNRYTLALAKEGELAKLLQELEEVEQYSPLPVGKIPAVQSRVSRSTAEFLAQASKSGKWFAKGTRSYSKYPAGMVRRQHTPEALAASAIKHGFKLEHVVYWHAHAYPPRYEKYFPRIYNRLAVMMGPLGCTPLGAWLCSSFLAVLKKK